MFATSFNKTPPRVSSGSTPHNRFSFRKFRQSRKQRTYAAEVDVQKSGQAQQTNVQDFDFKQYMMKCATFVNEALDYALPLEEPQLIFEAMRYQLLAGGKRVRPALCLAANELVGGSLEQVLPTACAHEMVHTMTLIHDDLPAMDSDEFRRGKPSCWKQYGEDMAILAGDAMLTYAFEYIARETKNVDPTIVLKVIVEFTQAIGAKGVTGGQVVDIQMAGKKEGVDLEVLQYIHKNKTAKLLESAVVCGALLGGATEEDIARLRTYALNIGLAFQVVDDILDVTQTTEHLGKTAAKDVDQDKTTYPKLLGLERSREVANELIAEAKAQLSVYEPTKAAPLVALADYILNRTN
eukprot:TRINITY_DN12432_c0_g1_i2.p2 TRINITY_DN12432_c0_g1~~TRINITY_DN12432_c0_g1_i2.p2  ORF type:complete len:366 (-),score=49.50 TRINITY_DN12432_c0_g1_i2:552-1607(-)